MGSKTSLVLLLVVAMMMMNIGVSHAQLSSLFYVTSCPTLENTVRTGIRQALQRETRMGASLLRLFFHDCFVNGCDGSILLADTATFTGEQNALPNAGSARGYEVIDSIKAAVEASCPGVVSCADILAIAAKESVVQLGGPTWVVPLGRRDARSASKADAERDLPSPFANLDEITTQFAAKNLSPREMTALSGGHTLGSAQCFVFRARIHDPTANIDPGFAATRRATCPAAQGSGDANLAPFDTSAGRFDNAYYRDLVARRGLLSSDQVLFNNASQDALVRSYSASSLLFFRDFAAAMVKMGNLSPLTGSNGEIRRTCQRVN